MTAGKTIRVSPDLELYYEDRGQGPVLVIVPGLTCTTEFFVNNLDELAKSYRVICYDPRSQGNSTLTEHGNNFDQRGRDLAALLDRLALEEVSIAGWSLGAFDAYAYMAAFGLDRVRAFINIDMPPKVIRINDDDWAEGDLATIRAMYHSILDPQQPHFFEAYARYMIIREAKEEEVAWIVAESQKTPLSIAAQIVADANLCDYSDTAIELAASRPVMHFIKQDWSDIALAWLGKYTPSVKTRVMGGHMMFWEEAAEFNTALADFLGAL